MNLMQCHQRQPANSNLSSDELIAANDAVLRRYAGLSVPRYTSYPRASQFTSAIGTADKARWLETLSDREPVSLYVHIPYCREISRYCGCTTKMVVRDHLLANYGRLLAAEIELTGQHLRRPPRVTRLHWGGGTPSLLQPESLNAIIEDLAHLFVFEPGFEHSIELDPRGVTPGLACEIARIGINCVSLGVQDLDPDVQGAMGRVQPLELVEAAFAAFHDAGLGKINVDLIYGLPKQTVASVTQTAQQVARLCPGRIACYGYAHLPKRKRNQRLINDTVFPDAFERFAQGQAVAQGLAEAGYQMVGIDDFARPEDALAIAASNGRLDRNFQAYTDDVSTTLIGFGASAVSCMRDGLTQNFADLEAYAFSLGRSQLPVLRGHRMTDDDRERGAIIRQLMCAFRVDLGPFDKSNRFSDEIALLRPMMADGLLVLNGCEIAMTRQGRPFVGVVAAVFDAFRQEAPHGFSAAV